jgi:hypothetical protein
LEAFERIFTEENGLNHLASTVLLDFSSSSELPFSSTYPISYSHFAYLKVVGFFVLREMIS